MPSQSTDSRETSYRAVPAADHAIEPIEPRVDGDVDPCVDRDRHAATVTVISDRPDEVRRRRIMLSTLLVVALVAGGALALQQLSAQRDSSRTLSVSPALTNSASTVAASTGSANSSEVEASAIPEPTTPITAQPDASQLDASQLAAAPRLLENATPAQVVPSTITWTVVDASSPEALAAYLDRSHRYALLPLIDASPATDDAVRMDLYEQVNGSWSKVKFDDTDMEAVVSGDTVYGIGTVPAVPGGPPVSFGTFDVASAAWQLHAAPEQSQPYQSDNVHTITTLNAAPIEGGMIASVTNFSILEQDRFPQLSFATPYFDYHGPYYEGNAVVYFVDCDVVALNDAFEANPELSEVELFRSACTEKSFDATELGMSQADYDAVSSDGSTTLWKITADSIVPFVPPALSADEMAGIAPTDGVLINDDGLSFTLGADGTVTRLFGDVTLPTYASFEGDVVARGSVEGSGVGVTNQYLLTASPSAPTKITDVTNAVTTPTVQEPTLYLEAAEVAGPVTVATGTVEYVDPTDDAAPITLTDSGVQLVITEDGYELLDADGSKLPTDDADATKPSYYLSATDSGKAGVHSTESNEHAPFATFDIDWNSVPGVADATRSVIVSSADGINVAIDDPDKIVRDAIGLDTNQHVTFDQWSSLGSISVVNGQIILPAYLTTVSNFDTPTGQHVVLIGTPA